MEIKKSAEQIIRDDVKRRRRRRIGYGIFFFCILLLLGIIHFYPRGGDVPGAIGLLSPVVALAGCLLAAVSWKCPICDSPIYKSGACKCQPSRRARSARIHDLKRRVVGPDADGGI